MLPHTSCALLSFEPDSVSPGLPEGTDEATLSPTTSTTSSCLMALLPVIQKPSLRPDMALTPGIRASVRYAARALGTLRW